MNVVSERQRQGILPFDLTNDAVVGSNNPISRKASTDDWEAHRKTIIRLYVDEKMGLSAVQDRLREHHDFLNDVSYEADFDAPCRTDCAGIRHRTFKSKPKV